MPKIQNQKIKKFKNILYFLIVPVPPPYQTTFGGKDSSPLPTSTYYPTSPSFPNPSVFPTSSYGNVENSDTSWVTLNQVIHIISFHDYLLISK